MCASGARRQFRTCVAGPQCSRSGEGSLTPPGVSVRERGWGIKAETKSGSKSNKPSGKWTHGAARMYLKKKIFDNSCLKESVLKIIEVITMHCCPTLNVNSHIMTTPPNNNSLIFIIRLRDPPASRRGNAALTLKSWLLPTLFISRV